LEYLTLSGIREGQGSLFPGGNIGLRFLVPEALIRQMIWWWRELSKQRK